jgi:hypothetical protein
MAGITADDMARVTAALMAAVMVRVMAGIIVRFMASLMVRLMVVIMVAIMVASTVVITARVVVVIMVSVIVRITVVITVSVMVLVMASVIVAITVQAMAATTTWHTTDPTTPILELSATRLDLTSRQQGRYVWWSPLADSAVPSLCSRTGEAALTATRNSSLVTCLVSPVLEKPQPQNVTSRGT